MLRLLTAAAGEPLDDEPADERPSGPSPPRRPYAPSIVGERPEIS